MANGDTRIEDVPRGSFIRWQGRTIEQLGYALNLILTLSVAALGYELALLLDDKIARMWWQDCLFALSILSLVLLSRRAYGVS